jgi:hypothetical protein
VAAPDARSAVLAAAEVAAAGPAEAVAARPREGVEAPAEGTARPRAAAEAALVSLFGEPDAAVVAVQPGVVAALELAAPASVARPAWQALQRAWAAAEPAFLPPPERPALLQAPGPSRQLSADPRGVVLADWSPAVSGWLPLLGGWEPRVLATYPGEPEEQVWRWDSSGLERARPRPVARAGSLWRPGPAGHWPSAAPEPEAAH